MGTPNATGTPPVTVDRRTLTPTGRAILAGIQVREEDVTPASGGRAAVTLFRLLSGVVLVCLVAQVFIDLSGQEAVPLRELVTRAGRLAILSGLFWGASQLSLLLSTVHEDLRVTRILLARMAPRVGSPAPRDEHRVGDPR